MASIRRSDYDITNTVRVSSPQEVLRAVEQLLVSTWPHIVLAPDGARIRRFRCAVCRPHARIMPASIRSITIASTRSMSRWRWRGCWPATNDRSKPSEQLTARSAPLLGVILALFHDVGYLRRSSDREQANGAEFTRNHVSRGAEFLRTTCRRSGWAQWADVAAQIIHFTGYERPFDQILTSDARDTDARASARHRRHDRAAGGSLLSGEMPRPAVSGIRARRRGDVDRRRRARGALCLGAGSAAPDTGIRGQYARHAPRRSSSSGAYRYLEMLFDGRNPYIEAIDRNMQLSGADPAQRELAHAAPKSAAARGRSRIRSAACAA